MAGFCPARGLPTPGGLFAGSRAAIRGLRDVRGKKSCGAVGRPCKIVGERSSERRNFRIIARACFQHSG